MKRLMNDQAVTWAATQTSLALHDRVVLMLVSQLLGQREDVVVTTPATVAAVYEMSPDMVAGSMQHLCECAYLTQIDLGHGGTGYRVNFAQTRSRRRELATTESKRPYPHWLAELHQQETTEA